MADILNWVKCTVPARGVLQPAGLCIGNDGTVRTNKKLGELLSLPPEFRYDVFMEKSKGFIGLQIHPGGFYAAKLAKGAHGFTLGGVQIALREMGCQFAPVRLNPRVPEGPITAETVVAFTVKQLMPKVSA